MKKSSKFMSLILILCLNQGLVNGANIQPVERKIGKLNIAIDPRMELLSAVQLLSNYPMINRGSPYSKDILNYFAPFSSQEAVVMTDGVLWEHGFVFDAPVKYMMYLSQPPELERQITISNDSLLQRSGGEDNLEQYRKSIKQFAEISDFETFWNSKQSFYNQILDMTISDMTEIDFVKTLEDYFNETKENYNVIVTPAFMGGYGFETLDADGKNNVYACIPTESIKDSIPYILMNHLIFYAWHEFAHPFVNPLADKYADRVSSLEKLFEPIKDEMSKQAYMLWQICVNEHIVRAVNVRLRELYLDSQKANTRLEYELNHHFIYIEPLIEKLKDFEKQRDEKNITFSEFYPELLQVLNNLQEK
ncbi:MAG: DUF4932 domain-containing protein [Prevotellaceae bacterium]|jgi:hypothetical protein|nr:DUF4932 domain-containing protein [Prevotellaceae bacterium]